MLSTQSQAILENPSLHRKNTYYMLSKYLDWKFEALVVFGSSPKMLRTMGAIFQYIQTMTLTPMDIQKRPDTLYVDAPCLVTWFDGEENETRASMTGRRRILPMGEVEQYHALPLGPGRVRLSPRVRGHLIYVGQA